MTSDLAEWINSLSDLEAVKFLAHFSQMLLDKLENDVDQVFEVLEAAPESLSTLSGYDRIKALALGEAEAELTETETITLARQFLATLVQSSAMIPLLERAEDTFPRIAGPVDSIKQMLTAGLVASTLILVATPEVSFQIDENTTIHKPSTSLELVTPLVTALAAMAIVKK